MRLLIAIFFFSVLSLPSLAASCTVSTSGVAFGAYDPLGGAPADSSGSINVSCTGTSGEMVNVTLSTTATAHNLQGPHSALAYQLYVDAGRTQVWGDGTSGTTTITGALTVGSNGTVNQSFYVYGAVPGGQNAAQSGSYVDTTVIVNLGW